MALASTSVRVSPPTPLTLIGPNGSGKTTLLRVIAGLLPATAGRVTVGDRSADERHPSYRAKVAALIGPPPLAHNLTLLEHLTLVGTSWGADVRSARAAGERWLDVFDVGALRARFPHELSSGQAQAFALALTLTRPFEVLLLDEPEQRLDTNRVATLASVLRELAHNGANVILASHSPALTDSLGGSALTLGGDPEAKIER